MQDDLDADWTRIETYLSRGSEAENEDAPLINRLKAVAGNGMADPKSLSEDEIRLLCRAVLFFVAD